MPLNRRLPLAPIAGNSAASVSAAATDVPASRGTAKVAAPQRFGAKVRALRRREGMSQVLLAEQLAISPSYLNLIENNRRPLPANLLIKLAQLFSVDVHAFAGDEEARLASDLTEAFADPFFDEDDLTSVDVRELTAASPTAARAVLSLYNAYLGARAAADDLSSKIASGDGTSQPEIRLPSEEVGDLLQRTMNHFPELEANAEEVSARARGTSDDLYAGLVRHLHEVHGIAVEIGHWGSERGVLRRFDPERKLVTLSELLPTRSRMFQLAYQVAAVSQRATMDRITSSPDARLTSDEARTLARIALGNYFAAAVLMPYTPFLEAAKKERYDIDVLGRRFRVGFEHVCHRFTTLQRPGAEGVPFHFTRIDVAGNISKRFSGDGIQIARFAGACPRWNIFSAFLTPGMIRIQTSRMPDGNAYFCISRTTQKDSGGYHAQHPVHAIGLGCRLERARELVYSDGIDVGDPDMCVPVGVTCRLCERTDCAQRAFPSLKVPLRVDENVRGASLYAPGLHRPPR